LLERERRNISNAVRGLPQDWDRVRDQVQLLPLSAELIETEKRVTELEEKLKKIKRLKAQREIALE
jgi:hypothetical protein